MFLSDSNGERGGGVLFEKMLETRTVLLSGEINKDLAEKVIRQLLLLEATDDGGMVKIFIDSPGGDADAGFAIVDVARFIKPDVCTVGMGLVASAAALVLLASPPKLRLGLPNSHYMIHQPLSGIRGVATEIEIHAKELEKLRIRVNQMISDETGRALSDVENDTDRNYWMSAGEAKDYNLISRVISSREELDSHLE